MKYALIKNTIVIVVQKMTVIPSLLLINVFGISNFLNRNIRSTDVIILSITNIPGENIIFMQYDIYFYSVYLFYSYNGKNKVCLIGIGY